MLAPRQKPFPDASVGVRIHIHPVVSCRLLQRVLIADDKECVLRPRERDVESPLVRQEPDPARLVRSHGRENDDFLLPALEPIDRVDLYRLHLARSRPPEDFCESFRRPSGFERVDEEPSLRPVRRNDANVSRIERRVAVEEVADNLDNEVDFGAVQNRLTARRLGSRVRDERDGDGRRTRIGRRGRLRERKEARARWRRPRSNREGVLQLGVVEAQVRERRYRWPHSVLSVEQDRVDI